MEDNGTTVKKREFPLKIVFLTAMITLILFGGTAYFLGYLCPRADEKPVSDVFDVEPEGKQLYTCGMHPWIISEEPGDCPICGMKLTPKRDDSASGDASTVSGVEITIDPVTEQNMGLRTTTVEKGELVHTIRTYGHITYDETRTAQVSPKFNGWFEKLYINFTGEMVQKEEPLFEIYSPELLTAQEEYLIAYRTGRGGRDFLESARRRLQYFDVGDDEIRAIEAANRVKKTMTIRSPFTGVVTHKNAIEGGFVKAGTKIYSIADLSRVWVEAHIYEYELHSVSPGLDAEMTLPYLPGKVYSGKVTYVYPYLQRKTRDVVIRLEFENPNLELKPDMYGDVRIRTLAAEDGLLIPSEAVIRSGERNIVFVMREQGKFAPREIGLGIALDDGKVQIISGLEEGEIVVTSGQFLLDSESKLKEAVQKMMEAKSGGEKRDDFFDDIETQDDFFDDME